MTRKKIKAPKPDINFTLEGVDGPVEYSLIPMKQKTAAHVAHNSLAAVLAALGGALGPGDDKTKLGAIVASLKDIIEFDDLWFILKNMMANGMVDDVEIDDLDNSDVFDDNPLHMYLVAYHGIKGNWPGVFLKLETKMGGFVSKARTQVTAMMDTEASGTGGEK